MDQQRQMRDAFVGFAHHISSTAQDLNATWPMVRVPNYELHAGQVRLQSGAETVSCFSFVEQNDEDEYLDFVTTNYEDNLKEGHLIRYGNLNRLIPVGYTLISRSLVPMDLLRIPLIEPFESRYGIFPHVSRAAFLMKHSKPL